MPFFLLYKRKCYKILHKYICDEGEEKKSLCIHEMHFFAELIFVVARSAAEVARLWATLNSKFLHRLLHCFARTRKKGDHDGIYNLWTRQISEAIHSNRFFASFFGVLRVSNSLPVLLKLRALRKMHCRILNSFHTRPRHQRNRRRPSKKWRKIIESFK